MCRSSRVFRRDCFGNKSWREVVLEGFMVLVVVGGVGFVFLLVVFRSGFLTYVFGSLGFKRNFSIWRIIKRR